MTAAIQVSSQILNILLRYIDEEGIANADFRSRIEAAKSVDRISIEHWWGLLEELATLHPIPALGIQIGMRGEIQDAGILGYLAASCDSLVEAVARLQRFEPLLQNLSHSWVKIKQDHIYIGWEGSGNESTVLSNDVVVSGTLAFIRKLIGTQTFTPLEVELAGIPVDEQKEYERLLGCPVVITDDVLAMKLPLSMLQLSIDNSNPQLRLILEQQAESILATLPKPDEFLKDIQQHILNGLEVGQLSMKWLAGKLGISESSLYRKLSERGRSYQNLLDELRCQLAIRYIKNPDLSLTEISLMLGFSEHSAFTRAFKKWVGQTPLKYRNSFLKVDRNSIS